MCCAMGLRYRHHTTLTPPAREIDAWRVDNRLGVTYSNGRSEEIRCARLPPVPPAHAILRDRVGFLRDSLPIMLPSSTIGIDCEYLHEYRQYGIRALYRLVFTIRVFVRFIDECLHLGDGQAQDISSIPYAIRDIYP